jgi:hypothetical protein
VRKGQALHASKARQVSHLAWGTSKEKGKQPCTVPWLAIIPNDLAITVCTQCRTAIETRVNLAAENACMCAMELAH